MDTSDTYLATATTYVDGVRVLFTPSGVAAGERGGSGPVSFADLTDQAEQLLSVSAQLKETAAARLDDPAPAVRAMTSTALLAKTLTDLEVSSYLLQAAQDEEAEFTWASDRRVERGNVGFRAIEPYLKLVLGEVETDQYRYDRAVSTPNNVHVARIDLSQKVESALFLISDRAGATGKVALEGLVDLGLTEVAKAAGFIGMNIADALGHAEKVSQLYNLFREFLLKAYDSLLALLDPRLLQTASEQVKGWVEKIRDGVLVDVLLEKLFETKQTNQALQRVINQSQAELVQFVDAIHGVGGLNEAYRQQIFLADKILPKLKYLAMVSTIVLPLGRLLLAAAYIALGAYVILAGADYVDAPSLKLLDRVPGVRKVVEVNIATTRGG